MPHPTNTAPTTPTHPPQDPPDPLRFDFETQDPESHPEAYAAFLNALSHELDRQHHSTRTSQNFPNLPKSENVNHVPTPETPDPTATWEVSPTSESPFDPAPPDAPPPEPTLPRLKPRQSVAIHLLLSGCSDTDVADRLRVSRRTLYNWRASAPFAAHLARCRENLYAQTSARLAGLATPAIDRLSNGLYGPSSDQACRAARNVLRAARIADHIAPQLLPYDPAIDGDLSTW